jgi:hypothetical protein
LVLATVRNYYFASKLAALLDMSGGGGTPQAQCLASRDYLLAAENLKRRVLRDPAKKPVEAIPNDLGKL